MCVVQRYILTVYAELKELSETKDNVHFLQMQTLLSCCVLPTDGDSLSFNVIADVSSEDLRKELSCREAPVLTLQPPEPRRRDKFLQYSVQSDELFTVDGVHLHLVSTASNWFLLIVSVVQRHPVIFFRLLSDFCPLTLDLNMAHKDLHLSEWNKKVTCERTKPEYPDHPDRFDYWEQVLCREALTGTHSYWEVECTGDWILIGVAYKGLSRKGRDRECNLGINDKSWSLLGSDSQYAVRHNDPERP
ncbi:STXB protein, partial [Polypterus senegalus]